MKKRTDKERHTDSISTLLGEDARIEGHLDFGGTLRLDGKLEGTLTGRNGTLIAVSYTHLTLPTIPFECRSRWSPYH